MFSRSGDIGPINLRNSLQNGGWRANGSSHAVTSNLVCGHLSSSSASGPNLVILALMVSKRRCRHGDGVRGLSHKRLRQLRCARALKTVSAISKYKQLFKFGVFISSRSEDIGRQNLKNTLQNGR